LSLRLALRSAPASMYKFAPPPQVGSEDQCSPLVRIGTSLSAALLALNFVVVQLAALS
jgi:hypothetical protein